MCFETKDLRGKDSRDPVSKYTRTPERRRKMRAKAISRKMRLMMDITETARDENGHPRWPKYAGKFAKGKIFDYAKIYQRTSTSISDCRKLDRMADILKGADLPEASAEINRILRTAHCDKTWKTVYDQAATATKKAVDYKEFVSLIQENTAEESVSA